MTGANGPAAGPGSAVEGVVPGEVITTGGTIALSPGAPRREVIVRNLGDRPIQVGSHFHFAQANSALEFDREAAHGHRLDIPAGTAVRFEPGIERSVALVPLSGRRIVPGLTLDPPGPLDAEEA